MISLRWYLDMGDGREALLALREDGAVEAKEGPFPVGILPCEDGAAAKKWWHWLHKTHRVNATMHNAL